MEVLPKKGQLVYAWDKNNPDLVVIGYFQEKTKHGYIVQYKNGMSSEWNYISTENPFPAFIELP
jgi:hypothetical protein